VVLKPGEKAPSFELPDAGMELVRLSQYKGKKKVVLFFYPSDRMPQCSREAINFSDHEDDFSKEGAVVLGVSRDDILCHADFCEAQGLSSRLLSDEEGDVCRRYDVLHERDLGGMTRTCVDRVTYVIDRQGVVRHVVEACKSSAHVQEVLKLVKEMN
jgi:peroxiredoxin Q/BCP